MKLSAVLLSLVFMTQGSYAQNLPQNAGQQPQAQAAAPTQVQAPQAQQQPAQGQNQNPSPSLEYLPTPYTEFGDFSDPEEEHEMSQFYKHGRFFGVSVGSGFHGVEGNRGNLWRGGFPMMSFRMHYWFDFNFGLTLEYDTASHFYEPAEGERVDINMSQIGLALKYYVDARRSSAAIAFSNPYFLLGFGDYSKIEKNLSTDAQSTLNTIGGSAGFGLEFPITHKKTYFNIEGRAFFVPFTDRLTAPIGSSLSDLQGLFYQATCALMFTW
ncbi:MAG: hypothetical protein KA715_08285 [Xanthomonadaceae bacterium]|nr:hypothetical protein [Xanthomonadaceae bacterium]